MFKRKSIFWFLAAILAVSMLTACGTTKKSSGSSSGEETYVVATDNSFVPFEFVKNGQFQGFDIDLIKAIAKQAGFKVKIKGMAFDGIIPGVQAKRYDMGIAGITITSDREKKVDFSDPYYKAGLMVGVRSNNTTIKSVKDLKGKTIGTKTGTTSQDYIEQNIPNAKAVAYDEIDQAYQALASGRSDAVLYDMPNLKYYIKTKGDGKIKAVGQRLTAENYGIVMQKNSDMKSKVDKALAAIKKNGTYDKLYKKWFGTAPSN